MCEVKREGVHPEQLRWYGPKEQRWGHSKDMQKAMSGHVLVFLGSLLVLFWDIGLDKRQLVPHTAVMVNELETSG